MNYLRTAILLAGLTALFMGIGYLIGGGPGAAIALLIAGATNMFAYWNSDRMVLSTYGAQEVDQGSAPELVELVAELAGRAGLPMPRVFVMDNPQPNAFATGRNPQKAAVAVTTGLMRSLSREELAGVIAHELAHVARMDWTKLLLARVATALFWFNPLVWILAREAHQLREEAADDAVLGADIADTDYATLLVGVARQAVCGRVQDRRGISYRCPLLAGDAVVEPVTAISGRDRRSRARGLR